jgi:hypothetical protein
MLPDRRVPTRAGALVFALKAALLRARRAARDLAAPPPRHHRAEALTDAPVLASVRTPLWTAAGGAADQALNAGKVENLRRALAGIDGIEIGAGEIFSFWRQIGRPVRRRGFAMGRELREGCMIATVGGGLCQLSNALYEAALEAGLEIVERHPHTRIVPDSRAAAGRDATIFWNYLDLQLRGEAAFRIEARLTADLLELVLRGAGGPGAHAAPEAVGGIEAHDCLTCGMTECRRHAPDAPGAAPSTAWLVDAPTPEFVALCRAEAGAEDLLLLPTRRFGAGARAWPELAHERTADLAALRRSLTLRTAPARAPRAALMLAADARLAACFARRLPPSRTRLRIAQSLLPHLWLAGVLQGRRFEVLVDRLPMDALQRALDDGLARHPDSLTLGDFRAPLALVAAERAALAAADRLVTAHRAAAAALPPGRVDLIDWAPVAPLPARHGGRTFLLTGPELARKGIHALRAAMAGLDMRLLVERGAEETPGFWSGLDVRILAPGEQPAALAGVVLPALVEHRPHMLLRALAAGLPTIATAACGLPPQPGLTLVAPDDAGALRAALTAALPG